MFRPCYFILPLAIVALTAAGCAGLRASGADRLAGPIRVKSDSLSLALTRIAGQGDGATLVVDPGWREYFIEIENISTNDLTVQNVKMVSQDGGYVDSASAYEQITAPPDAGAELAADVAETAAGVVVGQIVPFGGQIFSVLSRTVSASSAEAGASAQQAFGLRVLKNVEIAPAGKVERSAFLPAIPEPRLLVVDYAQDGTTRRIEIPLPVLGK